MMVQWSGHRKMTFRLQKPERRMWQCCHSFPFCPQGSCPQASWSGAREARTARSRRRPRTASSAARISSWASFRVRINPNPNLHCQSKFAERRGELAVLQYLIPISCGDHIVSMIVSSSSFLFISHPIHTTKNRVVNLNRWEPRFVKPLSGFPPTLARFL